MVKRDIGFWNTEKKIFREYFPSPYDLIIIFLIVILALRVTLFTPGYLGYADIGWPLSPYLYGNIVYVPSLSIDGAVVSIFSLTRDFISWPYLIILTFTKNMQIIERAYLFYGLYLFGVGSYIFAKFLLKTVTASTGRKLNRLNSEIVKHSAAIFAFSNLVAINYLVDGGFFSDDLIMLFISMEILATWALKSDIKYSLLTGVLLSLTIFLDPDYYIISIITIFIVLFVSMYHNSILHAMKRLIYAIIISSPALILVQFALSDLALPGSSIAFYRSLSSVYFDGSNHIWWLSVALLGHAWSIITFGPPSVMLLGNLISKTPGILYPTQILLPSGFITYLWLFSVFLIPIVAFVSLIFKRTIRFSIPLVILIVVGIILSVYGTLPALFNIVSILTEIPYVGGSIATSFSLPGHFLMIIASGYLILFPLTLYNVLVMQEEKNNKISTRIKYKVHFIHYDLIIKKVRTKKITFRNRTSKHQFLTIVVMIIIVLMVFADWQTFNGSFYPARADNSYRLYNGVPNAGSLSPYTVPKSYLNGYDYIMNQSGSFNVYWPIGLSNPPTMHPVSLPGFTYLGSHYLTSDVSPYLISHSVKFVAVYDILNFTQPLFYPANSVSELYYMYFGQYTFNSTLNFLNSSSGLNIVFKDSSVYIYKVNGVSSLFYQSSFLLRNSSLQSYPYVYSLFENLGVNVSTTNQLGYGHSFGINSTINTISIISPSYLSRNVKLTGTPQNISNLKLEGTGRYYSNSLIDTHNSIFNETPGDNENNGGFVTTDWSGDFSTNISDGIFALSSQNFSNASVEYGGPPVEGSTNGVFTGNMPVSSSISFNILNSTDKGSVLYITAIGLNATLKTVMYQQFPIIASNGLTHESLSVSPPPGTMYFTFNIEGFFSGKFTISDINMTFNVYPPVSHSVTDLAFGNFLDINNSTGASFDLGKFNGTVYASVSGTGSLNGINISSAKGVFKIATLNISNSIIVKGNISVAYLILVKNSTIIAMEGNYVIYNVGAVKSFVLTTTNGSYHPIVTADDLALFINVTGSDYSISIPSLIYIQYAYYAVILYLLIIIIMWRFGGKINETRRAEIL